MRAVWLCVTIAAAAAPTFAGTIGSAPAPDLTAALDRVVVAVEGAESSHGADPAMWRADPDAPQGPMQVSAAAAADIGAGDRFDERQNRALGRAYLARMYHRYGSWPDAVAAYNWGPGHVSSWINGGRLPERFPAPVARYSSLVLARSGLIEEAGAAYRPSQARLAMLRSLARRELAERRRSGHGPDEVERLYADIMRASRPTAANPP
jgi:hypothetical protein